LTLIKLFLIFSKKGKKNISILLFPYVLSPIQWILFTFVIMKSSECLVCAHDKINNLNEKESLIVLKEDYST